MAIDAYGITDIGLRREENQDQFLVAELGRALVIHQTSLGAKAQGTLHGPSHAQLLAVADGVGGSAGGALASQLAVQTLVRYTLNLLPWCARLDPEQDDDLVSELKVALEGCRSELANAASEDPSRANMATTLTLAFVIWPQAWILNVGDSRAYLAHGSELTRLTQDQTVAVELAAAGAISESAALRSRWRSVLSNSLGGGADRAPEVTRVTLTLGDTLLLCSDGLTAHVADEEITQHLISAPSSEDACQTLVSAANEAGGSDNVTCVVARFFDAELSEADTVRLEPSATPR